MEKNNFIYFTSVEKVLHDNDFFGFTAKRNKETNRITYTYKCVRYPNVIVKVLTTKLNPNEIPSNKIVLGIKFNDKEINGWKDFITALKEIYKYNKR